VIDHKDGKKLICSALNDMPTSGIYILKGNWFYFLDERNVKQYFQLFWNKICFVELSWKQMWFCILLNGRNYLNYVHDQYRNENKMNESCLLHQRKERRFMNRWLFEVWLAIHRKENVKSCILEENWSSIFIFLVLFHDQIGFGVIPIGCNWIKVFKLFHG
jgi:hypothetical protein